MMHDDDTTHSSCTPQTQSLKPQPVLSLPAPAQAAAQPPNRPSYCIGSINHSHSPSRIMRRLISGLLLASSSLPITRCSDNHHLLSGASVDIDVDGDVVGSSSSSSIEARAAAALHSARNKRSIESVSSTIRSLSAGRELRQDHAQPVEYDFEHVRRKEHKYRRRQQRRRQNQGHNNADNPSRDRDLIVGGSAAPPGRFPYVVSLQLEKVLDATSPEYANTENGVSDVHTCGGTLIAMDVVLTAGHCGYEELPSSSSSSASTSSSSSVGSGEPGHVNFGDMPQQIFYGADVGAYNLTNNDGGGYEVDNMLFEKLVLHPDYTGFHGKGNNRMSLQHDVMLVKLYGASDQPVVRLHNPEKSDKWIQREPVEGDDLVVTGWGDTDPASGEDQTFLASVLHAATVHYVPNDVCEASKGYSSIQASAGATENNKFEDYFEYDGTISDDMMCALGKSQQDACQGDSGGGLLRLGSDSNGAEDIQMGIVSWGLQCGDEDFPGVYARVGDHYDWISQQVCELSDSPPNYFNCPTKPYPPGSPYDPVVDLTITIRFDNFRRETGWLLESVPDFRNVVFRPFGTYTPKTAVDENNAMSETIPVHSGRFYMLSILDEFADGLCCTVGEGYFRVDSDAEEYPIVDRTLGIMWTPHALRRMFYVSPPASDPVPPDYVTVVVTLGIGADPGKLLLVALENAMYEAMMLYEIQPFVIMNDSRAGTMTMVYTRTFRVPVLGKEFGRQKYNVMVYDDNEDGASKASFEVYLGDASSGEMLLAQSGSNYGENENDVSRSFVLNKKKKDEENESSDPLDQVGPYELDMESAASLNSSRDVISSLLCMMIVASLRNYVL